MKSFGRISGFYCSNIKKPRKHSFAGLFNIKNKNCLSNQRQLVNQVFGAGIFINVKSDVTKIHFDGSFLEGFKLD